MRPTNTFLCNSIVLKIWESNFQVAFPAWRQSRSKTLTYELFTTNLLYSSWKQLHCMSSSFANNTQHFRRVKTWSKVIYDIVLIWRVVWEPRRTIFLLRTDTMNDVSRIRIDVHALSLCRCCYGAAGAFNPFAPDWVKDCWLEMSQFSFFKHSCYAWLMLKMNFHVASNHLVSDTVHNFRSLAWPVSMATRVPGVSFFLFTTLTALRSKI